MEGSQGLSKFSPKKLYHLGLVSRMDTSSVARGLTSETEMNREVFPPEMLRAERCRKLQGFLRQDRKPSV